MNSRRAAANAPFSPKRGIRHHHFNVRELAPGQQLFAWRDRVGHVVDVLPFLSDMENPFSASIDRYQVDDLMLTDCRSDFMRLERSLTRISQDRTRDFAFQVFLEGGVDDVVTRPTTRNNRPSAGSILALDMNQPFRMHRHASRLISFFVPGELIMEIGSDPDALHGRIINNDSPLARLILEHAATLADSFAGMEHDDAVSAIHDSVRLLTAAFGKQAGLHGNARAAARAARFRQVRRYIQAHVHETGLSPDKVCEALGLPRRSLYRLFEHEGGLDAYIQHVKLRCAADELVRFPQMPVMQIAYGLGFTSPSAFTHAFRRAYKMSPHDFRQASGKAA